MAWGDPPWNSIHHFYSVPVGTIDTSWQHVLYTREANGPPGESEREKRHYKLKHSQLETVFFVYWMDGNEFVYPLYNNMSLIN